MKASLSEFSMSELMELARRAKDKVVVVKTDTPFLRVIFEGGEPVFAIYRNLKGREAFLASMFVDDGEVEITPIATEARIKKNLDATFDQLLSEFSREEEAYLEARSLVDSLERTVEPRFVLDKEQTLCIGKKEWNVLVALLKGMSLREAAADSGTAEYIVIETISTFLKLGALSLGQHKLKEDQQVIQSQIVSSLVDVAVEVGDRPLSGQTGCLPVRTGFGAEPHNSIQLPVAGHILQSNTLPVFCNPMTGAVSYGYSAPHIPL